ncbi:serine/threonine-protein phosphatase 5 [Cucumis melo var. makuwa]|uniref:Serine/threonine-protein phosphatase 5 n=1 Tax=Cucumis melo var. makuwa TaxID=1194695 RepID=A0A5D3DCC2_CUCMM|nr:serine/threonine-protein phosphatase 5 [Cucumis melo var. makuwa]
MPVMEADKTDPIRAEELKSQANEAFKAHKYAQAIDLYTQAIELNGQNAVYWANRAFAHTKLEEYGSAIQDASKAIEIDPKYSKGYYRRGAAFLAMGKLKEALKDFQQLKKICPNDPDAAKKLKECEKAVMKLKFEEAISVPESERRSVADSIDFHLIGGSYVAPCDATSDFPSLFEEEVVWR